MPTKTSQDINDRLEQLLVKAGARHRAALEKRLATLDSDPDEARATIWRRFLVKLGELVTLPAQPYGANAIQFFVPDGKYRMQVFALDDVGNGLMVLYLPDVLAKAVKEKLLVKNTGRYSPAEVPSQSLTIEQLDSNTLNPPDFVKNMMGWNRKAIKLTLHISPSDGPQLKVAEQLCDLAATQWEPA
jgi:hypothetical protein